jgi:hypothetical protein
VGWCAAPRRRSGPDASTPILSARLQFSKFEPIQRLVDKS